MSHTPVSFNWLPSRNGHGDQAVTVERGGGSPVAVVPAELGPQLAVDTSEGWLRWSRFTYELPPDQSGRRRSLWRQLRRMDAIKLAPAEWAMAHDEHDDPGLAELVAAVRAAGGSSEVEVAGRSGIEEVERQVRLCRGCEALWDPFFNALDRVADVRRDRVTAADLDRLRRRFASELARDVVLSDAARRASRRLAQLADEVVGSWDPPAPPAPVRPRVEIARAVALDSGAVRYLARVEPTPTLAAERAFDAFEAAVYRPSSGRIKLQHGTFLFSCRREDRGTALASLRDRLRTFSTFQG